MKFPKSSLAILVSLVVVCKGYLPSQKSDVPQRKFISNEGHGSLAFKIKLKHPRILIDKYVGRQDRWFEFKSNIVDIESAQKSFMGSWVVSSVIIDEKNEWHIASKISRAHRQTPDLYISIFTQGNTKPYSCRFTDQTNCGFSIRLELPDMIDNENLFASAGEVSFTSLGTGAKGQKISGRLKASDQKYFEIEMSFDFVIEKVRDYSKDEIIVE